MWRRFKRILLIVSLVISVVLSISCAIAWPISHQSPEPKTLWSTSFVSAQLAPGELQLTFQRQGPNPDSRRDGQLGVVEQQVYPHLGFARQHIVRYAAADKFDYEIEQLSFWAMALAFGLNSLTLIAVLYLTRRRLPLGRCPNCKYDLRAHKAGDKCPDCGTQIAPAAQTLR